MSDTTTPEENDTALTRLARDPLSRRRFFVAAGGTAAASALLVACGDDDDAATSSGGDSTSTTSAGMGASNDAIAQFGKGDVGILNYALTLEYIEDDFYSDVIESGLFKGDDLAAPAIKSKELLATAGSIVQVEARHAARVRLARNQPPAPNAFDPTLTQRQVLKAVQPFIQA